MADIGLIARDVACRRGDRVLLRGVSFALAAGDALHLVGPNGIGKSSLIRVFAGLLRPFSGDVRRTGTVGLIDDRPALDADTPLGEALAFWRRLDGGDAGACARLGLAPLRDVPVRYLSTGQRRRAAFARLIGQRAGIWLLDEPLNALDADAARLVETLTAEHRAAGGITVIASHQPFALPGLARLDLARFAGAAGR